MTNALSDKADSHNTDGGFAGGSSASADTGGAIGNGASTTSGGAIGNGASALVGGGAIGSGASATTGGGAVGNEASTTTGGAVGYHASTTAGGGAVGSNTKTSNGFAGGNSAKTVDSDDTPIDAIQLGTGTNNTPKTLQIYTHQLMDANGQIPAERMTNALNTALSDHANIQKNSASTSGDIISGHLTIGTRASGIMYGS